MEPFLYSRTFVDLVLKTSRVPEAEKILEEIDIV